MVAWSDGGLLNMQSFKSIILYLLIVTQPTWAMNSQLPQPNTRVEHLKAVFILNFTQFVEWPSTHWKSDDEPLMITVLNDKAFANFLRKVVKGEFKDKHPILVREVNDINELESSHILFVGKGFQDDPTKVFSSIHGKGTLTVSDAMDFAKKGGVIRFYLENGKMRIQINRTAASVSGLQISSKLLSVAQVIETDPN